MASAHEWYEGARPRTLPAAIAPVAAGTGLAFSVEGGNLLRAVLALVVAIALQVGVNYANDYSDGIKGTDKVRVGPVRLVGQGLADPADVKHAAFAAFAVAAIAGLALVWLCGQWWLIVVGAACIAAGWFYTGGKHPYGYLGLGEVFVFVFFGLVPVLGTQYVQSLSINLESIVVAVGVGAFACAILVANNLRDIPTDIEHNKRTLAVRLGDRKTRVLYMTLVTIALVIPIWVALTRATVNGDPTNSAHPGVYDWGPLLALLAFPVISQSYAQVRKGASGRDLIPVLKKTGEATLVYGLLLGVGLAIGVYA